MSKTGLEPGLAAMASAGLCPHISCRPAARSAPEGVEWHAAAPPSYEQLVAALNDELDQDNDGQERSKLGARLAESVESSLQDLVAQASISQDLGVLLGDDDKAGLADKLEGLQTQVREIEPALPQMQSLEIEPSTQAPRPTSQEQRKLIQQLAATKTHMEEAVKSNGVEGRMLAKHTDLVEERVLGSLQAEMALKQQEEAATALRTSSEEESARIEQALEAVAPGEQQAARGEMHSTQQMRELSSSLWDATSSVSQSRAELTEQRTLNEQLVQSLGQAWVQFNLSQRALCLLHCWVNKLHNAAQRIEEPLDAPVQHSCAAVLTDLFETLYTFKYEYTCKEPEDAEASPQGSLMQSAVKDGHWIRWLVLRDSRLHCYKDSEHSSMLWQVSLEPGRSSVSAVEVEDNLVRVLLHSPEEEQYEVEVQVFEEEGGGCCVSSKSKKARRRALVTKTRSSSVREFECHDSALAATWQHLLAARATKQETCTPDPLFGAPAAAPVAEAAPKDTPQSKRAAALARRADANSKHNEGGPGALDIYTIRKTWAAVCPEPTEEILQAVGTLLFARIFDVTPGAAALFSFDESSPNNYVYMAHVRGVVRAVDNTVAGIKEASTITALEDLGAQHAAFDVQKAHYDLVGAALLWTLEAALGPQGMWSPGAAAAWTQVWVLVAKSMQRGQGMP